MLVCYSFMLVYELSWVGLIAPFILISGIALQFLLNKQMFLINKQRIGVSDLRAKKVNEMVTGIKMIKFNTWEKILVEQIKQLRLQEKSYLMKLYFLKSIAISISICGPILSAFVCFSIYNLAYGSVGLAKTYAVLSILNGLTHPLRLLQMVVELYFTGKICSERLDGIRKFELKTPMSDAPELDTGAIEVYNADFAWSDARFDQKIQNDSKQKKNGYFSKI